MAKKTLAKKAAVRAQLKASGLTDEQVAAIDEYVANEAARAAREDVASLAGLVLQHVQAAGVTNSDPAHRTSGALFLNDALAGAFAERLQEATGDA